MSDTNVVTLVEAKEHLRVDVVDDDTYITGLILGAVAYCEERMKQCFLTTTVTKYLDRFPGCNYIEFDKSPLISVVYVKYTDYLGVVTTLPTTEYVVDTHSFVGKIVLAYGKSWPTTTLTTVNAIEIQTTAGYGAAAAVPQMIKQAILLLIGHWYANREAVLIGTISKKIEMAVDDLLGLAGARVNV